MSRNFEIFLEIQKLKQKIKYFIYSINRIDKKKLGGEKMTRYEELSKSLGKINESKKGILLSLLRDFCFLEEQINSLRDYPRYIVNPKNPTQQKKLPVHDMLKDYQAQKNDIATKILRTLDGETIEESPLLKALARYSEDD